MVVIFHSTPKESHMKEMKKIFRYLKGTLDFGLWYPKRTNIIMTTYTDGDWVGSIVDQKRTSENESFFGDYIISWLSKKQPYIPISAVEAEYIVASYCCTQIPRVEEALKDVKIETRQPITIYYDNTSAISLLKNPIMHLNTKHILIKCHFL